MGSRRRWRRQEGASATASLWRRRSASRPLVRASGKFFDGLVAGRPNKVIAFDLGISVRTVEVHRARMMERLGTRKLADAVRLAVLAKLAPPRRDR